MADAIKDQNFVPTILGTSNVDGDTTVLVYANETNHAVKFNDGANGSNVGGTDAPKDSNNVVAFLAVSSNDGVTPVPVYANSSNELLVNSA